MEGKPCAQKGGNHAASLLASLNLQRERAQFYDCVVTQTQTPGHLYPVHRCVLAAFSPVLASILSSAGALVELQAPCLSDAVLALVLDYIYTGSLPHTQGQQHYSSLLSAACYLQMDALQQMLRTEVNPADTASSDAENQSFEDKNNTKYLQLPESQEKRRQYWDEADMCGSSKNAGPLITIHSSSSVPESTAPSVNAGSCKLATHLAPQDLIQSIPCMAEVLRVDKEVQGYQLHSAYPVKSECCQMSRERLVKKAGNRRSSDSLHTAGTQEEEVSISKKTRLCLTVTSPSEEKRTNRKDENKICHCPVGDDNDCCFLLPSPSLPHQSFGAVPVIRHSSTAVTAEVPSSHLVFQPLISSSRATDSRSGNNDNGRNVNVRTIKHKNHREAHNLVYNTAHNGTQSRDYENSSDQYAEQDLCYKSNAGQYDTLKQDYNSTDMDPDEHVDNRLSDIKGGNALFAHCDSFQNRTKHFQDDSLPANQEYSTFSRGLKSDTDLHSDEFPSRDTKLKCTDCHNVLIANTTEEHTPHSQDAGAAVPLPLWKTDTGSVSDCEGLCPKGYSKEEHSYSCTCQAEMDRQHSPFNPCRPQHGLYRYVRGAETRINNVDIIQHGHDGMAIDNGTGQNSLEQKNMSGTEISEPHASVDNMSDPAYDEVGQSYRGHLHCHCFHREDTHLAHGLPNHPNHSDQASDEEEDGTFAGSGLSPLKKHFANTDKVLLLDISTKPAEYLVSYRSDEQEKWVAFGQRDTSRNGLGDSERQHEASQSVAEANKRKINSGNKYGTDHFDEAKTRHWIEETNVKDIKSDVKEPSTSRAEVIHTIGSVEGENHITTLTVCPCGPDSVQAPISSTLSVFIPSTFSASMPTNITAQLSAPVHHPFQCSLCNRSFSQKGSLNRHMRSHLGIRPFPCPCCPMTFSRQYRVMEHMRVHQR